jgi:hypothetical protein
MLGATDGYIAGRFAARATLLAALGGTAGALAALPVLLDPQGAAARAWGARGIPTTIVVDKKGQERARLEGEADWASPDAADKVRALIAL